MRYLQYRALVALRVAIALVVTLWALPAAAVPVIPVVSIEPSVETVFDGDQFSLAVDIGTVDPSDIDDVNDLYAFQLTVTYNPDVLAVVSVNEGDFLSAGGPTIFFEGATSTPGLIEFIAGSLLTGGPGVSGAGTLFAVTFRATDPGISDVAAIFNPANNDSLEDSEGNVIPALTVPGIVTVLPSVPEPSVLLLLAAGGFGMLRRNASRQE